MPSEIRAGSFDERWLPIPKHVDFFDERIGGAAKAVPLFIYRREGCTPASTSVDRALHAISGSEGGGAIARRKPARRIQALIPDRREQCRAARSGRGSVEVVGLLSRVFG